MLTVKEKGLLLNIIKHCKRINLKIEGMSEKDFVNDDDAIEIICFNIFQIGELAKNFTTQFIEKYNDQPWKQIKGMRDKVGHGYGTIDYDRLWNTAQNDINPLLAYCEKILSEDNKNS